MCTVDSNQNVESTVGLHTVNRYYIRKNVKKIYDWETKEIYVCAAKLMSVCFQHRKPIWLHCVVRN